MDHFFFKTIFRQCTGSLQLVYNVLHCVLSQLHATTTIKKFNLFFPWVRSTSMSVVAANMKNLSVNLENCVDM